MPGTDPSIFHILTHLIITPTLWGKNYFSAHLIYEETKAQNGYELAYSQGRKTRNQAVCLRACGFNHHAKPELRHWAKFCRGLKYASSWEVGSPREGAPMKAAENRACPG